MSLYTEHKTLIRHRHSHIEHTLSELPELSPLSIRLIQTVCNTFEIINVHKFFQLSK